MENTRNVCLICGKEIEENMIYCSDCKLELEIQQFEAQVEM